MISYMHMTPLCDGTATNIRMYFIFLENRSIGLHFAADNISRSINRLRGFDFTGSNLARLLSQII